MKDDGIMRNITKRANHQGLVTVEVAITVALFTMLLLAVIEIGRWMFVWNAANEMARLGARAAAVCPVNSTRLDEIARFVPAGGTLGELDNAEIEFSYLARNGSAVSDPEGEGFRNIDFVRAQVTIRPNTVLPFLEPPPLEVQSTRRRESLGILPGGVSVTC